MYGFNVCVLLSSIVGWFSASSTGIEVSKSSITSSSTGASTVSCAAGIDVAFTSCVSGGNTTAESSVLVVWWKVVSEDSLLP